jgi:hypothetical protein
MKEWIIPVIIAVVWILNALLRNRENDEPARAPRGKAAERPGNRNAASEIDRFLQEIERMKKQSPDETAAPSVQRAPAPKVRPVSPPPRVRPVTVRPAKGRPIEAASVPVVVVESAPAAAPLATPLPSGRLAMTVPIPRPRAGNRALAGALAMLRSPNSAAHAIVLTEILGPPKSKRS